METNIRALEALGKSQESFGDLLVPVIMTKLQDDTKRNLARTHQGEDWTIQDLRQTLKQELRVLEAGSTPMFEPTPTASHTGVRVKIIMGKSSYHADRSGHQAKASSKSRPCTYCKGNHSAINCAVVVDPKI